MFLASSFEDVADLFVKFTDGNCVGKSITFIPTASIVEEVNFYVRSGREALRKRGLIVEDLEISNATKEQVEKTIIKNDYIYISGGNAFFLLQELRRKGADKFIAEQISSGKTYIGESTGSVVVAPNIEYIKAMDDLAAVPYMDDFSSLGVINCYPVPHYESAPFEELAESIIAEYQNKMALCPIRNNQAIIVKGDELEIWDAEGATHV